MWRSYNRLYVALMKWKLVLHMRQTKIVIGPKEFQYLLGVKHTINMAYYECKG